MSLVGIYRSGGDCLGAADDASSWDPGVPAAAPPPRAWAVDKASQAEAARQAERAAAAERRVERLVADRERERGKKAGIFKVVLYGVAGLAAVGLAALGVRALARRGAVRPALMVGGVS